jgi:hypothetical protein
MRPRLLLAASAVLAAWLAFELSCARASVSPAPASQHLASASAPVAQSVTATPTAVPDAIASHTTRETDFTTSVRPILLSHCAPCHEPGGKMYERLPFDRAETIASHREGVLKRIKAPDEKAAIEKWLAAQPGS